MNNIFTLAEARSSACSLFECVVGSQAYGTARPQSDEDIKGVFVAPKGRFYGLDRIEQVNDASNDTAFYEVGRYVELLLKNNPTVMEMLFAPESTVRHRNPLIDLIGPEDVLSKQCEKTFAMYAATQIKKARGLNKKIVNPMPEKRKTLPDFCHVIEGQGSVSLCAWLEERGWSQEACGLVKIPHMRDVYGIYHNDQGLYRGIWRGEDPSEVRASSVSKEAEPVGWLSVNIDGFKKHCQEHRAYWDWVEKRNDVRYQTNRQHDRGYDSKNLMHTIRLLDMALEIAEEQTVRVRRPNRDFLMRVLAGEFAYDELLRHADERLAKIQRAFASSGLPDAPNREAVVSALVEIRAAWYER